MREVAKRAGVSSATVSRVINGSPLVREDTAAKVRALLAEVNFIPNPVATTLKYGRSKTFGLIIPDIRNPFYAEFIGAFEDLLLELDHEMLVTSVQDPDKLVCSIRRMLMRQVDGVVLMSSEFDTRLIEPLLLHKIPIVTIDRRSAVAGCSDVTADFVSGFTEAAQHLKSLGHSDVGYVGGTPGLLTTELRAAAFRRGLETAGLRCDARWMESGNYRLPGGEAAIQRLLAQPRRPTAVMTANDMTAFGVIRGLHAAGLCVGKDMSVIGVDDIALTQALQPPLTTIRIPIQPLAQMCIEALNHTKEDVSRPGRRYSLRTELVIRESTGKR